MFRALRKVGKTKEKFEYRFRFHATRVPTGYEKLVVSLIPVETGRLGAQTPRALVKAGSCQWTDTISEEVKLVRDSKTKAYEKKIYKLVVSTGSIKGNVLGEGELNLAEFAGFAQVDQRQIVLRNCSAGTVLHITVQCVRLASRDEDDSSEHTHSGSFSQGSSGRGRPGEEGEGEGEGEGEHSDFSDDRSDASANAGHPPGTIPAYTLPRTPSAPHYRTEDMGTPQSKTPVPVYVAEHDPTLPQSNSSASMQTHRDSFSLRPSPGSLEPDPYSRLTVETGHRRAASVDAFPRPLPSPPRQYYIALDERQRGGGGGGGGGGWESASQGSVSSGKASPIHAPASYPYKSPSFPGGSSQVGGALPPLDTDQQNSAEYRTGRSIRRSKSATSPRPQERSKNTIEGDRGGRGGGEKSPRYMGTVQEPQMKRAASTPRFTETETEPEAWRGGNGERSNQAENMQEESSPEVGRNRDYKRSMSAVGSEREPMGGENMRVLTRNLTGYGDRERERERERVTEREIDSEAPSGRGAYYFPGAAAPLGVGPIPPDYSPAGSVTSSVSRNPHMESPVTSVGPPVSSRDLKADLVAAEAAIEELQNDSIIWQRASRNLTREVENLRQQLAEAMTQDRAAEAEIEALTGERDRLREEVERLHEGMGGREGEEEAERERSAGDGSSESSLQREKREHESMALKMKKLQESNREMQITVREAEALVEQYRKDLEELYEANQEREGALKKAQLALDDREREWRERMKKVIDAHNLLEAKLAEAEARVKVEKVGPEEGERQGRGAGEAVEELQRKVDELEREAQELTVESLQLAADLNKAEKDAETKAAIIERLQSELEKGRVQSGSGKMFSGWGTGLPGSKAFGGSASGSATAGTVAGGGTAIGSAATDSAGGGGGNSLLSAVGGAGGGAGGGGIGVGEAVAGVLGVVGLGVGAGGGSEIQKLRAQVKELEKQLKEEREREREGGGVLGVVGGPEDVLKLKNKVRIAEMATQRAQERLSILETIEKRADVLENEVRDRKEEMGKLVKSREEWERVVKAQMEELRRGKEEAERRGSEAAQQLARVEERVKVLEEERETLLKNLTFNMNMRKELEEANSNLAGEKMDVSHRLGEADEIMGRMREKVAILEEEVQKLSTDSGMAVSLKADLEAKVGGLMVEKQSLERQVRVLEEEKRLHASRVQELELQLSAVTEEFEEVRAVVGQSGRGGMFTSNTEFSEMEKMRAELKMAGKRVLELEGLVRVLREEREAARAKGEGGEEANSLREERDGRREELERRLEEAVDGKNEALLKVAELVRKVGELEAQVIAAGAAKREAETRVLGLEGATTKLQQEVQEAQAGRRSALEKVGGLEGQLAVVVGREAGLLAAREGLEREVGRLRREVGGHVERYQQMEGKIAELETAKMGLEDTVRTMAEEQVRLRERRREVEGELAEARQMVVERGEEMKVQQEILAEQMEKLKAEKEGLGVRVLRAEEAAKRAQEERLHVTERLHEEIQKLTEQLTAGTHGEGLGAQALLVETTELRAQVGVLADRVRGAEGEVMQARREREGAMREAEEKGLLLEKERYIAKQKEVALLSELEEAKRGVAAVSAVREELERERSEREALAISLEEAKSLNQSLASLNAALEGERLSLQEKQGGLQERNRELEKVKAQLVQISSEKKSLEEQKLTLTVRLSEAEGSLAAVEEIRVRNALLEGERETLAARAEEGERLREENGVLTEQFVQLQSKLDSLLLRTDQKRNSETERLAAKAAAVIAEEAAQLRMQNTELKRKIAEQKAEVDALKGELGLGLGSKSLSGGGGGGLSSSPIAPGISRVGVGGKIGGMMSPKERDSHKQVEELRRKMVALEGELQKKAEALAMAERRLGEREREREWEGEEGGGGQRGRSSRVGPLSPLSQRESKEVLKLHERIRSMESEMKAMAGERKEREAEVRQRERALQQRLTLLNGSDEGAAQAQDEMARLRSEASRVQEELRTEIRKLREANERLQRRAGRAEGGHVGALETELAEALENCHMYKEQLRNLSAAFADNANVRIPNDEDEDSVIREMVEYRKKWKAAEDELARAREQLREMRVKS